jgi:hypothetical protein
VKIALYSMEGGMRTEFCVYSCIAAHDNTADTGVFAQPLTAFGTNKISPFW